HRRNPSHRSVEGTSARDRHAAPGVHLRTNDGSWPGAERLAVAGLAAGHGCDRGRTVWRPSTHSLDPHGGTRSNTEGESPMRKARLVAVIAAITLVGCGSTRTVNLTSFGSTAASSSSASSRVPGGMRGTASAVAACLKAAGAAVRGPQAAGEGFADYATTRDGGNVGFVQAGDALNVKAIGKVFARAGDHITTLKKD